jgi:ATP-binding cassette subfamily B protein
MDSDLIVVMNNGEIDGVGVHEELMNSNSIYQEIYNIQNKVGDSDAA